MTTEGVLLFADRLPPAVGGMEMHARYFIEHFAGHPRFPLLGVITRDDQARDCILKEGLRIPIDLGELAEVFIPAIVLFNSGRWIEDLVRLREIFPSALFVYRTGGNEILKASLDRIHIPSHKTRQGFWVGAINRSIDLLFTNSAFTEERLRSIGVGCRFARFVGGVNIHAVSQAERAAGAGPQIWFCAARFVPYKNHHLLLEVARILADRGIGFELRLAGDGPLFADTRSQVIDSGLQERVTFLGVLDNLAVLEEICRANMYIQLSSDHVTAVEGGSYVHSEGMGRSILEALTAGTFVVAGNSGALPEIVTVDRGLLVDLTSAREIADCMEPLVRASLPRASPSSEYSWQGLFSRYEHIWEQHNAHSGRH